MSMLRMILLAAAVAAVTACSKHEPPAPAPRAVIAQVVGAKPTEGANVYSGEVRARHENDLAFRVGGKVVARYVDVGATVKKGTELARLDPQDAQLGVESARSQLAAAEADHALAKAELARYRDLYAKQYVSKAVLDARENTFNTTKARLEQARAQAQVARNQSSYTTLVAEADGVITAVNVEAGQVVSSGQPVLRFARPEEKEVAINVPETRLARAPRRQPGRGRAVGGARQAVRRPRARDRAERRPGDPHVHGQDHDRRPRQRREARHDGQRPARRRAPGLR